MELIDEGNTIPFIARYRKEAHGSLDDQALRQIADRLEYLRSLEKKKEEVARLIEESGSMTSEVSQALEKAETLSEIDRYLPSVFDPKRKTACISGKSKRIAALADWLLEQNPQINRNRRLWPILVKNWRSPQQKRHCKERTILLQNSFLMMRAFVKGCGL